MNSPWNSEGAAVANGCKRTPTRDTVAVEQISPISNAEWAGRGTIADITKSSEKKFQSLPQHIHDMLKSATAQLLAQNSIVLNPLAKERPISAVEQFEWARYNLDTESRFPLLAYPTTPRQPVPNGYRRLPNPKCKFGDQQADPTRRTTIQNDYVKHLISQTRTHDIRREQLEEREKLRVELNSVAREALRTVMGDRAINHQFSFHCYGSFSSGFATQESNMDLLFISKPELRDGECDVQNVLFKAFLSAGFGAAIVPSVREPGGQVINVWTILLNQPGTLPSDQSKAKYKNLDCNDVPGPQSSVCRVQFSKTALSKHTTTLLRCYRACDRRVNEMALFIKNWARARRINDPEKGFLSSYGYTLMLLHYLMNVANPPVVPNLQRCDRNRVLEWVDDFEVYFWRNTDEIEKAAREGKLTQNCQSTASLLCGFFAYYSITDSSSQTKPFVWMKEVISIRNTGGLLQKQAKGWVRATWNKSGAISRYLLAIEDPFEENHNVAWTVDANSVSIIQNEFDRANRIINRVQLIPGVGWEWRYSVGGVVGEDFFATREVASQQVQCRRDDKKHVASGGNNLHTKRDQPEPCTKPVVKGSTKPNGAGEQPELKKLPDPPEPPLLEKLGAHNEQMASEESSEAQVTLHFDLMQLRDLATIQAGGNGCRRKVN